MSARRSTGVILIASGSIGIFIGLVLSATGLGAICGIPMVLVCIIMVIWGYLMKAKDQAIKDEQLAERMLMTQAVASGVNLCPKCKTPNQNTSQFCSSCGFQFAHIGDGRPVSAVDPADAALRNKQVRDQNAPVFEPEEW
jgi:hypothetical protein